MGESRGPRSLLAAIQQGITLPFLRRPQPFHKEGQEWTDQHVKYWRDTLEAKLLQSGAIAKVDHPTKYVSNNYLVEKSDGVSFRHIVDLRPLNVYFGVPHVRFESLSHLPDLHARGEKSLSFDLADGYYALGIAPAY